MESEQTVAEKPVEMGTIFLPKELLGKVKIVAAHCDETMSEIVTKAATPGIERRFRATLEKLNEEHGDPGA